MATYYRSDQAEIHVEVGGVAFDKESWDMMEGGDPVATSTPHYPGGMAPQVELGGLPHWPEVTVERGWSESLIRLYKQLVSVAGTAVTTISYIQLGANKQPTGEVLTYTGVLLGAERPKYKSSESTEAMLKITVGVNGTIS